MEEAPAPLPIGGMFHINLNCTNFDRSLAFYKALGFEVQREFPPNGHWAVAKGLGVGDHQVKGALLRLGDAPDRTFLDLLEWMSPPSDTHAHPKLTDAGLVRIALWTTRYDEVLAGLRTMGVEFISEPVEVNEEHIKMRFVCFRDPDGNVLELVERSWPAER